MSTEANAAMQKKVLKIKGILKRWKIIFLVGVIGAIGGFFYAKYKNADPSYLSKLTFTLEESDSKSKLGGLASLAGSFGVGLGSEGGNIFSDKSFVELLKSRNLIEKTLLEKIDYKKYEKMSFADLYIKTFKMDETPAWKKNKNLNKIKFETKTATNPLTRDHDSVLGKIFTNLLMNNIMISKKSEEINIYIVEMNFKDEVFSKFFPQTLIKKATDLYVDNKTHKTKENFLILGKQVDSVRAALYADLSGLAINTDNTFMLNPALNIKRLPSAQKQVSVQANTAILGELVKNHELLRLSLLQETPLIQVIDEPIFPLKIELISKIKALIIGFMLFVFVAVIFILAIDYVKNLLAMFKV